MLKKIVSLIISLTLLASVLALNVSAEDIAELMALERDSYSGTYDAYGHTGTAYATANDSYAYACVVSASRPSDEYALGLMASACVENSEYSLSDSVWDLDYVSIDFTLGELPNADECPMTYSSAETYLGSYDLELAYYYNN